MASWGGRIPDTSRRSGIKTHTGAKTADFGERGRQMHVSTKEESTKEKEF